MDSGRQRESFGPNFFLTNFGQIFDFDPSDENAIVAVTICDSDKLSNGY